MMSGDVVLEDSQPGKGCTFSVRITFQNVDAKSTKVTQVPAGGKQISNQLASRHILLIDDVEDNRLLIERMLIKRGAKVTLAANGQEGLSKALSDEYDVVLMDIQMPVMDGYTATKKLREAGYKKPIIALTAHAMKDDRERCLQAGCTDYLTKPVQVETLVQTILEHSLENS